MFEAVINENDNGKFGLAVKDHFAGEFSSNVEALKELRNLVDYEIKAEAGKQDKPEFVEARFISEWEEGIVHTDVTVWLDDFSLDIAVADVNENYEHLESEYIEVDFDGKTVQLDVENGELTDKGKTALTALFAN